MSTAEAIEKAELLRDLLRTLDRLILMKASTEQKQKLKQTDKLKVVVEYVNK